MMKKWKNKKWKKKSDQNESFSKIKDTQNREKEKKKGRHPEKYINETFFQNQKDAKKEKIQEFDTKEMSHGTGSWASSWVSLVDFSGFVCEVEMIPWPVRSGKAMPSDSGDEGRNLCSERAFHHRHLRKLYKIILASLCRKITQKSFLGSCVGHRAECVRPVTLVPCSNDAHTFLISVEEIGSITIAGETSLQCLQKKCVACLLRKHVLVPGRWQAMQKSEDFVFFFYVGDAGNTSRVDAGTPLGATTVVTPGSAGCLLWDCCILASLLCGMPTSGTCHPQLRL